MKLILCFALAIAVTAAKPTLDDSKKQDDQPLSINIEGEQQQQQEDNVRVERSDQKLTSAKSTDNEESTKSKASALDSNKLENNNARTFSSGHQQVQYLPTASIGASYLVSYGPSVASYPSVSYGSPVASYNAVSYGSPVASYPAVSYGSSAASYPAATYGSVVSSPSVSYVSGASFNGQGSSFSSGFPAPVIPSSLASSIPQRGGINIAKQIIHKPVITELQEVIHKPVITEVQEIINKPVVQEVQQVIHKPLYIEHIGLSPSYHGYQQHIHKQPIYQQSVHPVIRQPISHGNTVHLADQYEHAVTTTTTTHYCAPGSLGTASGSSYGAGLASGSGYGYGAAIPYAPIAAAPAVASYAVPAPSVSYSAPSVSYATPSVSYSAPSVSYAAPSVSYPAPSVSYSAPSVSYAAPVVAEQSSAAVVSAPIPYGYASAAPYSYSAPASVGYTSASYSPSYVSYEKPIGATCRTGNEESCKNTEGKSAENKTEGKAAEEITFDTIQPYQQQSENNQQQSFDNKPMQQLNRFSQQQLGRSSEDSKQTTMELDTIVKNIEKNENMMRTFRNMIKESMVELQTDKKQQDKVNQPVAPLLKSD